MMDSLIFVSSGLGLLAIWWLQVDHLTKRERFSDQLADTFDDVLDLSGQSRLTTTPHNKLNDNNEPTFDGTAVTVISEVQRAVRVFSKPG